MNTAIAPRRFEFERDRFGFANELLWEYRYGAPGGKTTVHRKVPRPDYVLRCFVLVLAARQFLYHVRFEPGKLLADEETYRRLIRAVLRRNPRFRCTRGRFDGLKPSHGITEPTPNPSQEGNSVCAPSGMLPSWEASGVGWSIDEEIIIPGYEGLCEFSKAWEKLFKTECGGAWRSYFLRSHWRMVFPISREHQARTAEQMAESIRQNNSPIIHLVRFPQLNMNHGMILFGVEEGEDEIRFQAYDPNDPEKPSALSYDRAKKTFFLPANLYWSGGSLNIIEIFQSWWL